MSTGTEGERECSTLLQAVATPTSGLSLSLTTAQHVYRSASAHGAWAVHGPGPLSRLGPGLHESDAGSQEDYGTAGNRRRVAVAGDPRAPSSYCRPWQAVQQRCA